MIPHAEERRRCNIARELPDADGFADLLTDCDLVQAEWIAAAWIADRTRGYTDLLEVVRAFGSHAFRRGVKAEAKARAHVGGRS